MTSEFSTFNDVIDKVTAEVNQALSNLKQQHPHDKAAYANACMDLYFCTMLRDRIKSYPSYQALAERFKPDVWSFLEESIDSLYFDYA